MSGSHAITIRRDFDPVDDPGRVVEVKREFGIRADGLINLQNQWGQYRLNIRRDTHSVLDTLLIQR